MQWFSDVGMDQRKKLNLKKFTLTYLSQESTIVSVQEKNCSIIQSLQERLERHGINWQLIRRFYIYISGNFKRTIKADHILEYAEHELFCNNRFINHICKIKLLGHLINYKLILCMRESRRTGVYR